jgi:hypothetical protein
MILDVFDLNYAYTSEKLALCSRKINGTRRVGVIWRILSFFGHFFEQVVDVKYLFRGAKDFGRVLLFVVTKNQRSSLVPLTDKIDNAYLAGESQYVNLEVEEHFPLLLAYLLSLVFFPVVLFHFWRSRGYRRKTYRFIFDQYWLTYGYYLTADFWLSRLEPKALVISNDHNMPNRVMAKVAREKGIPSIYIQHASVTEKFPPLIFDYALLEGYDALQKYESTGPSMTQVFLVGMPKMDEYLEHRNTHEAAQSIGICTNKLDPLLRVQQLCECIRTEFLSRPFYLRPHPGDKRSAWKELAEKYEMAFSDPKVETSFEFLKQVDVIIAGDSNILLEAALMNVFPIYYDFAETDLDAYGFRRNGLVGYISEPPDVCLEVEELVEYKPLIRDKTEHYCATVNTPYDGFSGELAADIIQAIASGRQVNMSKWRRIPNTKLEAYELAV